MSDKTIELNRRRVLGGMITLGGAAAAAGAGTFAAFSDTGQSSGNSISTGTLTLALNPGSESTAIDVSGAKPGDSGYLALELQNSGSIDGTIADVNLGSVDGSGSFDASLASQTDDTPSDFEQNAGDDGVELDDTMTVDAFLETSGDFTGSVGTGTGSTVTRSGNESNLVTSGTTLADALGSNANLGESLGSGVSKYLVLNYEIPSGAGNELQDESLTFDVQVVLEQA